MPVGVYKRTEYHKEIISKCKLGVKYPNRKKLSLEDRKRLSEIHKLIGSKPPSRKGIKHTEESKRKVSKNNVRYWLGKEFSEEHRRNMSKGHKGMIPWNKGKGNKTSFNKRARNDIKYINWRKDVYERDDYTCWVCQEKGGYLHGHHLKRFALYPELRYIVSNGLTLCVFCHDTYTNFRCEYPISLKLEMDNVKVVGLEIKNNKLTKINICK